MNEFGVRIYTVCDDDVVHNVLIIVWIIINKRVDRAHENMKELDGKQVALGNEWPYG